MTIPLLTSSAPIDASESQAVPQSDSSGGGAGPSTRPLLLIGPSSILRPQSSEGQPSRRFLLLPHPRTGAPTYYLPHSSSGSSELGACEKMLELRVLRGDKCKRSWFLGRKDVGPGGGVGEREMGRVVADGALHLLSPIDALFLLLPIVQALVPTPDSPLPPFVTREDLFESAATTLYRVRAKEHNALVGARLDKKGAGGAQESDQRVLDEGVWEDVVLFGQTEAASRALERVCEVKAIDENTRFYRPSHARIRAELDLKVEKLSSKELFTLARDTLGRGLDRLVDLDATEEESAAGRTKIGLDTVRGIVPVGWI